MNKKTLIPSTLKRINKKTLGLLDPRASTDDGEILKQRRGTDMSTFFGSERASAVAYFVSDLIAKGFNDHQIIDTVKEKYGLEWRVMNVKVIKTLLQRLWRAEMSYTMEDQIAGELAAIQTQQKELWASWELSKKSKHTTTKTGKSTSPADEMTYDMKEVILEEDDKAGDPKIMALINDLGKERRKLLGLYAPEKKEGNGGNNIQINIVGENGGEDAASIMNSILSGASVQSIPSANTSIEDAQAEVIEAEKNPVEAPKKDTYDIDSIMNEVLGEE